LHRLFAVVVVAAAVANAVVVAAAAVVAADHGVDGVDERAACRSCTVGSAAGRDGTEIDPAGSAAWIRDLFQTVLYFGFEDDNQLFLSPAVLPFRWQPDSSRSKSMPDLY